MATSFEDQLNGCFSLNQKFIQYIADSGRGEGDRPDSLDMFF